GRARYPASGRGRSFRGAAAETSAAGLQRGRCSGAPGSGIGQVGRRVVADGEDRDHDVDTATAAERGALDDALEIGGREEISLEIRVADTVGPRLVRAGAC